MRNDVRRLVPEILFPSYTFVPGRTPHPRHPGGHSYGSPSITLQPLDPACWWECKEYLHGIDLFNGPAPPLPGQSSIVLPPELRACFVGFYWEAHEAWEGLWNAAGRTGLVADFLKGLIKLAATGVKVHQGQPRGVAGHAKGAAVHFRDVAQKQGGEDAYYLGLSLQKLLTRTEQLEQWATRDCPEEENCLPMDFDFVLCPTFPPIP